jgi:N-acylneuraminate cytidylyltransferase
VKTHAFVFARGGSKGVPGKNIRQLADKPLLGHAIAIANELQEIDRCFVSTDSEEIAAVAEDFDAIVINRPRVLAQDTSPEWLAWRHAINWVFDNYGKFERFVSLPATAPLRMPEDVQRCMRELTDGVNAVLTMTQAQRSPWFNMVKVIDNGYLNILLDSDEQIARRQDAPQAYDLTTVAYVLCPEFVMENESLWKGRVKGVEVPQERALDIDTEFDFKIAEYLLSESDEGRRNSQR